MPPKESQGLLSDLRCCDGEPWQLPAYDMTLLCHRFIGPSPSDAQLCFHVVHVASSQSRRWKEQGDQRFEILPPHLRWPHHICQGGRRGASCHLVLEHTRWAWNCCNLHVCDEQRMSLALPYTDHERQMHVSDCSFEQHPKSIGSLLQVFTCGNWSGCEVRVGSASSVKVCSRVWLCCRGSLSVGMMPADDDGAPSTALCCCGSTCCCCCSDECLGTCVASGSCGEGCRACEEVQCCRAGCCDGPLCAERTDGMPACA